MNNNLPCFHVQTLIKGTISIECSTGEVLVTSDYQEALDFLTRTPAGIPASTTRWVWLLSDFVKAIRELLPETARQEFDAKNTKRNSYQTTFYEGGWRNRIFFQVNKFFSINRRRDGVYGDHEVNFYELEQFSANHHDILCVDDLVPLSLEVSEAFASLGVLKLTDPNSPVAVIESSNLLKKVYDNMPDPNDIPGGCKEYAQLTNSWEAWSSAYQVGYWTEAYNYDLASAYPSVASHLVSVEGADYKFSKSVLPEALYGFMRGTLYINPEHPFAFCSPIVHPIDDDTIGNPVGKLKGYFTLGQVRFIERQGMGHFDMDKRAGGWFVFPKTAAERPLAGVMQHYYAKRSESPLMDGLCKRIIAGIIGRLGQFKGDEPTAYVNPVYHSTIRNTSHLLVAQELIHREMTPDELLFVHTDGFHSTRNIYMPATAPMGKWKCEGAEELLIASPSEFLRGDKCADVLDAIGKDKKGNLYLEDFDLFKLSAEQNRYFPKYPKTGGELVKNKFQSDVIILD